jgi:hypothetical protein
MFPSPGCEIEKGRSGSMPVRPSLNSYLKNIKLDTVNLPTFFDSLNPSQSIVWRVFHRFHILTPNSVWTARHAASTGKSRSGAGRPAISCRDGHLYRGPSARIVLMASRYPGLRFAPTRAGISRAVGPCGKDAALAGHCVTSDVQEPETLLPQVTSEPYLRWNSWTISR